MIRCPNCSVDNLDGSAYCDSCGDALGGAPAAPHPAAPVRIIAGRYRVERELGGGGQKQMYLAADLRLSNRPCALAQLTPSARSRPAIAEGEAMFRREAETLAALNNFHIVQIYDYFDEGGRCYLVEEYVRGQTLQQRIASRGRMRLEEIVRIALQVLEALEYLHGLTPPLLHRDLKPDNIILAPATGGGEVVKLIDFGIARHFQIQRGTVHGTPGYAAPEQYRGMSEPRTDLYALGGIIHYALTGRDPQEHEPFSFAPLQSIRPDLPRELCLLIDQTLSNEVERRPAGAAEFKARLLAAVAVPPNANAPQPRSPPPYPPSPHQSADAPTRPLPAPAPHTPGTSAVTASKIQWTPARVEFTGVQRGTAAHPMTVTVRNTGRGTLEARVSTDAPGLVRVAPHHIAENQTRLRVEVDSCAVLWGHRYRANINLVLDHSGDSVAIPIVITAADHHTLLASVRRLSTAALIIAGTAALGGEILLGQAGMTVSRALHGTLAAQVKEAADVVATLGLLTLLVVVIASKRGARVLTLIAGVIAIAAVRAAVAAALLDYLLFPAIVAALARGCAMLLRRPCIRFLARHGLGLWARLRAFLLLMAPPAAAMLGAAVWLMMAAVPAPSVGISPWRAPPYVRPVPYPASSYGPARPAPPEPGESIPGVSRRPVRPRAAARPQHAPPPPQVIESEIRARLSANGFDRIGVSVQPGGRVYLNGSVSDLSQRDQIEELVRGVDGVRGVVASLDAPRGWMGVTVNSGGGGAIVRYLMPRGPADRAGIALNDVIVEIDGAPIRSRADFHRAIADKAAGQTISVTLMRAGQTISVPVELRKKPFHAG